MNIALTNAVFDGGVEGIDDGWTAVGDPVGLVHRLTKLAEQVLSTEQR